MEVASRLPDGAQRVADLLRMLGHCQPVVLLPASGRTSAEAAAGLGCSVAEIAKSIVFRRLADDRAVMVVASGRELPAGVALASCCQRFTISASRTPRRPPASHTLRAVTRRRGAPFLCGEDESWP